jgi:hypothetical protein
MGLSLVSGACAPAWRQGDALMGKPEQDDDVRRTARSALQHLLQGIDRATLAVGAIIRSHLALLFAPMGTAALPRRNGARNCAQLR